MSIHSMLYPPQPHSEQSQLPEALQRLYHAVLQAKHQQLPVTFPGINQFTANGPSACAYTSMNAIHLVFHLQNQGIVGINLVDHLRRTDVFREILKICAHYPEVNSGAEINTIRANPPFRDSLRLMWGPDMYSEEGDAISLENFRRALERLVQTSPSATAALAITAKGSTISVLKIAISPDPSHNIFAVFDSHRPATLGHEAGWMFISSVEATASYLARLFPPNFAQRETISLRAHLNSIFTAHAFTTSYVPAAPKCAAAVQLGLHPEQRQPIQRPDPQAARSHPEHNNHEQQLTNEIQTLKHHLAHLAVQIEAVDDDLLQSAQIAIFESENLAELEVECQNTKARLDRTLSRNSSRSKAEVERLQHACRLLDEQAREKKRSLEGLEADAEFGRIRRDALVRRRDRSRRGLGELRRERARLREEEAEERRRERAPSSSLVPKSSPGSRLSRASERSALVPPPRIEMARQQISVSGSSLVARTSKRVEAAEPTTQPFLIPEGASRGTHHQRGPESRGLPDEQLGRDLYLEKAQHQ